jgi:hypothetical protein
MEWLGSCPWNLFWKSTKGEEGNPVALLLIKASCPFLEVLMALIDKSSIYCTPPVDFF